MKLIEAMKKVKDLQRKAEDIRGKISQYHCDMDIESPTYGSVEGQTKQVREWLQAHSDLVKEILRLRFCIQKTNINSKIKIELGGKAIEKTIAEWIHRRRDLSKLELDAWSVLNDKKLAPLQRVTKTTGDVQETKLRRYYDPKERDEMRDLYQSEPLTIDASLEIANAVTDLME